MRNIHFVAKAFLLALPLLSVSAHRAAAGDRISASSAPSDLNAGAAQLLTRYGRPTAICFAADSLPPSAPPAGVRVFAPDKAPDWAKSVLFSLAKPEHQTVWLYKRDNCAISFLIGADQSVEATCVAGSSGRPLAANGQEFRVMPTSKMPLSLGDDFRKITNSYGYPGDVRPLAKTTFELYYDSSPGVLVR